MKKNTFLFLFFTFFTTSVFAQWKEAEGFYGGEVTHSLVSDSTIYVSTTSKLYKSTNNGVNWTKVYDVPFSVTALAKKDANIFVGTHYFLYSSADNGNTWTKNTQVDSSHVISIVPVGAKIYVATLKDIYVSTNNGASWTPLNTDLGFPIRSMTVSGTTLVVYSANGNLFSTNSGTTWTRFDYFLPPVSSFVFIGTTLYAINSEGLFSSKNNGTTWKTFSKIPNAVIKSIMVKDSTLFAATTIGVYTTNIDGNGSWTVKNTGLTNTSVATLANNGVTITAGTNCGPFISYNNGENWTESRKDIKDIYLYTTLIDGKTNVFATSYCDAFISSNNGKNWQKFDGKQFNNFWYSVAEIGSNTFVSTQKGVFLSTDNGVSWREVNTGLTNTGGIYILFVRGTNLYGLSPSGTYLTTNNGNTWTLIANNTPPSGNYRVVKEGGNNIYKSLTTSTGNGIWVSNDNGQNWAQILNTSYRITDLAVEGANIYAATYGNGVIYSNNNGSSWTELNTGLPSKYLNTITVTRGNIFVGVFDFGAYHSPNNGATWQPINDGWQSKFIYPLIISGNYLLAKTSSGIFRRQLSEIIVGTKENAASIKATLSPNPVANQLIINASDELIGRKYVVTNILGENVQTGILTDSTTLLSVNQLANGIYFLSINGTNQALKFVKN